MTTNTMKFKKDELAEYRGDAHLMVNVRILDSRISYGREQYSITPVNGAGQRWVDIANLLHQSRPSKVI